MEKRNKERLLILMENGKLQGEVEELERRIEILEVEKRHTRIREDQLKDERDHYKYHCRFVMMPTIIVFAIAFIYHVTRS